MILLVFSLLAAGGLWALLRSSLPPDRGTLTLPGLSAPVDIRYDQWQRPYIEATALADALTAEGWLHASHRLWQMELFRRAGSGRMAEMLGPELVDTDKQLWRFGVPQLARRLAANAGAETNTLIDAYVRGVNAAIDAYRTAPPEFLLLRHEVEPWSRADVFALGALMAFQSSGNAGKEMLRAALRDRLGEDAFALFLEDGSEQPDFPFVLPGRGREPDAAPAVTPQEKWLSALEQLDRTDPARQPLMPRLAFGSNGWVVSPARSATGKALFAFDSHDALGLPNLFYEVHLFFGSGRQIRGWSVPGLPGVINGYNETIAWGFTNIGDSQDLFLETPVADRPGHFLDGDEAYAARRETVEIPVRDAAPVTLEILHTRTGPLISENPPLALRWTVHQLGDRGLDSLLAFNRARSWDEFNAALDRHAGPVLNATYADRDGNIGFRTLGLLPRRALGAGLVPLPAHPDHAWRGLVPAADMPRLSNPPAGFIAAANARVNPAGSYPLVSADNAAPYRIARLHMALAEDGLFTVEDMRRLQRDWYDGQAALLLPAMLGAVADDDRVAMEARRLRRWLDNPFAAADSGAALLFQAWYLELADAVFREPLGEALYKRLRRENYMVNFALDTLVLTDTYADWWPASRSQVLADSLARASADLKSTLGDPERWRLDRRQRVGLDHELSRAIPQLAPLLAADPQPWGGAPATVGRANYAYIRPFEVVHGATVRTVGEMSEPPTFRSVIPGGQSGHPLSPHYTDQFDAWRAGELLDIESRPRGDARIRLVPADPEAGGPP